MSPAAMPTLPRGVRLHRCEVRQAWFLLAPERAIKLDAIGHAILTRVDGAASFGMIVTALAKAYGAPEDRVAADVARFLDDLAARRIVDIV